MRFTHWCGAGQNLALFSSETRGKFLSDTLEQAHRCEALGAELAITKSRLSSALVSR